MKNAKRDLDMSVIASSCDNAAVNASVIAGELVFSNLISEFYYKIDRTW